MLMQFVFVRRQVVKQVDGRVLVVVFVVSEALVVVVLLSWWGYFVERNGGVDAAQTVQWQSCDGIYMCLWNRKKHLQDLREIPSRRGMCREEFCFACRWGGRKLNEGCAFSRCFCFLTPLANSCSMQSSQVKQVETTKTPPSGC